MWLSILLAAADDPSTVYPLVGAGGAGLSAVLFYLLLDEKKERRADKKAHEEVVLRMLPVLQTVANGQERVVDALSRQVEYHDRRPSDPQVLREAYDALEQLLAENPPPTTTRKRSRGTE